jgi:hypothetical protein
MKKTKTKEKKKKTQKKTNKPTKKKKHKQTNNQINKQIYSTWGRKRPPGGIIENIFIYSGPHRICLFVLKDHIKS